MRSATKHLRKKKRPVALRLRQDSTDAEMVFWQKVRSRQLQGFKFKRQIPIGAYIVDFLCPERGLVVEIDGGQHNDSLRDKVRDEYLATQNLKVIRFWNNDVLSNINGVLLKLTEELDSLSPVRVADGGRGQGVRGRRSKSENGNCCATPSSQPSPSTRASRAGEKEQEKKYA
ncbi:MAG: endonuclease domain-containing protein [Alphaproteobacteria bacterium]|nr:MAG: endonuclease domain-containing protein [Alphaproteobacteria bacterium]